MPAWKSERTENSEGVKMDKIVQINKNAKMEPVRMVQVEETPAEDVADV